MCSVAGHDFPWVAGRDCLWAAEDAQEQPGVPREPQCAPVRRKQNRERQRDEHREVAAVAAVDRVPEDAWEARLDVCRTRHRWADLQAQPGARVPVEWLPAEKAAQAVWLRQPEDLERMRELPRAEPVPRPQELLEQRAWLSPLQGQSRPRGLGRQQARAW